MKKIFAVIAVALSGCASTPDEPVVYFCDPSPLEVVAPAAADPQDAGDSQEAVAVVEVQKPSGCGG